MEQPFPKHAAAHQVSGGYTGKLNLIPKSFKICSA